MQWNHSVPVIQSSEKSFGGSDFSLKKHRNWNIVYKL